MTQTETPTAEAGMTTLREADAPPAWFTTNDALEFLDGLAESAEPGHRRALNSIITGKCAAIAAKRFRAALAASTAPRAPAAVPEELRTEAAFLLDRLRDFENGWGRIPDEAARDWYGHVKPAIARLSRTLAAAPAAPPADGGASGLRDGHPNVVRILDAMRACPDSDVIRQSDGLLIGDIRALAALSSRTPAGATSTECSKSKLRPPNQPGSDKPCSHVGTTGYDDGCGVCMQYTSDFERNPIICPWENK